MAIKLDDRNLGGRKFIYEQLYNHKKALKQVKPSLVLSPPKAHVDQGGDYFGDNPMHARIYSDVNVPYHEAMSSQQSVYGNKHRLTIEEKLVISPEYAEIRETYRRVHSVKKGGIDAKKPKCFHLSKKLTENRRRNMFHFEEHIKNLASLQRRLNSIGSVQDRKKNPTDPLAYPSMFFRKPEEFDRSTTLTGFANKININLQKTKRTAQKYEKIILDEMLMKYNKQGHSQNLDDSQNYMMQQRALSLNYGDQPFMGSMTRPTSSHRKHQNAMMTTDQ